MATRTRKAVKNISYNIAYQLIMLVMGFVNRTIFLYFLNVEFLGVQAIFKDVLALLSMADLGLITAMTYSFYKPLAEGNQAYISGLVQFYRKICNGIALVIFLGGLVLIPFLPLLVHVETEMPLLTIYYLLTLLNTVASYLVAYKTVVLVADQRGYVTAQYGSVLNILQNLTLALFLWWTRNFLVYLLIQVAFTYLYNFLVSAHASRTYPYINDKQTLPKEEAKELFKNIKSVFVYKSSTVLLSATDNTLISILVGTATVGFYSNYMLVVSKALSLITTAFTSMTSSLGNLVVQEGEARRYQVFEGLQSLCNILSIFVVNLLLFVLQDFIVLWLGADFLLDQGVLAAILLNLFLSLILLPVWVYREATGLYQQIQYVMLLTAFVNLGLSIWLGQWLGLVGILLATSVARLTTYFWYEPILLFRQYFNRPVDSYFRSLLQTALVFGLLALLSSLLSPLFGTVTPVRFILKSICLGLVSLVVLALIYAKSPGVALITTRLRKKKEPVV